MPAIVFTDPQLASVGLTEAAARAAGYTVRVSTIGLDQMPRALAARNTRGLIKLVADAGGGRLLGAHILPPKEPTVSRPRRSQSGRAHRRRPRGCGLSVSHTVEGLKLAALSFGKDVAKLSCCAG